MPVKKNLMFWLYWWQTFLHFMFSFECTCLQISSVAWAVLCCESERDIEMLLHKQSATDTHCSRYKQHHLRSTVTCCHLLSDERYNCCVYGSEYLKLYLPWRHQSQMMMLEKSIIWICQSRMTFLAKLSSDDQIDWICWGQMCGDNETWKWLN